MKFPPLPAPIRITLIYVVIASAWILFSDWVLVNFVPEPPRHQLESFKGVLFVLVTGSALFGMMDANERWHRRTEQTLQESEHRYRSLFQNEHSVMLLIDPQTSDILDANPAACAYYGYSYAELTRLKIADININAPAKIQADIVSAATKKDSFFSFQHRLANGELRDVEVYSGPITLAGKPLLYSIVHDITDRKRAAAEIQRLAKFPSENPSPVLRFASDGILLYANARSQSLLRFWNCSTGSKLPEPLQKVVSSVLQTGQPKEVEIECYDHVFSLIFTPIQEAGYVNCYGRDITERKQVEQALRESEGRFRNLFESMTEGVALHEVVPNADGQVTNYRILSVNPSFEKQSGLSASEAQGRLATEIYGVEDAPYLETYASVALTGQPSAFETYFQPLNKHFHVSVSSPTRGQFVTVFEDITDRKQAQEILRRSEERFSKAFHANPAATSITRIDNGVIVDVNDSFSQLFGYSREEVLGHTPFEINLAIRSDETRAALQHLRNNQSVHELELILWTKTGQPVNVLLSNEPIELNGEPCTLTIMVDITERKRAEEALRQSEQELKTLFDTMTEGFALNEIVYNEAGEMVDYRILKVNPAFYDLGDYHDRDVVGMRATELYGMTVDFIKAFWLGHRDRTTTAYSEMWSPLNPKCFYIATSPFVNGRFVTSFFDITQRKLAEQALQHSEQRYQALFEDVPLAIWEEDFSEVTKFIHQLKSEGVADFRAYAQSHPEAIHDCISRIKVLDVNKAALEMYKAASKGELIRSTYSELSPGEEANIPEDFIAIAEGVTHRTWEGVDSTVTGEAIEINVVWSVVPGYEADYSRVIVTTIDVTERKRAEEALRHSEERFSKAFHANPAAMVLTRITDAIVLDVNESYYKLFGFDRQEAINRPVNELNILLQTAPPERMLERLREFESIKNYEARLRTKSGQIVTVLLSNEPVELNGERCLLTSMVDITERKRFEEALEEAADELARSNAELEQFAYVASHDLQEPLRAVTGMLQLLQNRYQGQLDERADEFIGHAVDGATRMQALIKDLLALSRVGTKGKPFESVVMSDLLQIVLANLGMAIQESGATVTYDQLPTVFADATQMMQLFQNLVGNALKFRGQDPPRIHVSAERLKGKGTERDTWQFAVRDNGIGIESQYFERIFVVFQRLHTRREYPGTGIGLALCKKIVARHGGRIWVESQPGQGTTFFFTIADQTERKLTSHAR